MPQQAPRDLQRPPEASQRAEHDPPNGPELSQNGFKNDCGKMIEFGIKVCSKMVPWRLPGRSWRLPRQSPGTPKASPGSLCDSCLAPPGPPCKSLAPPWHCLRTSKSYFWSLGARISGFRRFGDSDFDSKSKICQSCF